jgi:hypothetical protein
MSITEFEKTIINIAEFLKKEKIPYMIIGGVANLFWGEPRTTLDVDVTVKIKDENIPEFITKIREKFSILVSEPQKFIEKTRVLPVKVRDLTVDIIFATLPYEEKAISRAVIRKVARAEVSICSVEDLIIYKIISERPKDINDTKKILTKQKKIINRRYLTPKIRELSESLNRPGIMKLYLEPTKNKKDVRY